jgi:hypothetical protein
VPDKERSRITHDRSSPKTANERSIEKGNKSGGSWIKRSGGGEIVKRPSNLGGDTGNGGSGDPPKKGE